MERVFEQDIEFATVAVQDVAEAVYRVGTLPHLHAKRYMISHETWAASDIHQMLNGALPTGTCRLQYDNREAVVDLGATFTPARIPLEDYRSFLAPS